MNIMEVNDPLMNPAENQELFLSYLRPKTEEGQEPAAELNYKYYFLQPQFIFDNKKMEPIKEENYLVMEVEGAPQDEIMQKAIIDSYSSREYLAYLSPQIDLTVPGFVGFQGYQLKYLNKTPSPAKNQTCAMIFMRQTVQNFDAIVKLITEENKKLNFYLLFAIAGVSQNNIKAFLQQKSICRNVNVVEAPPFDSRLFHAFNIEGDETTAVIPDE